MLNEVGIAAAPGQRAGGVRRQRRHAPDARDALAAEVEQILQHMVDLANSSHAGLYLFSGNETLTKPYELTQMPRQACRRGLSRRCQHREYEISHRCHHRASTWSGRSLFGDDIFTGILGAMIQLRDALEAGRLGYRRWRRLGQAR